MRYLRAACLSAIVYLAVGSGPAARAGDCNLNGIQDDIEVVSYSVHKASPSLQLVPIVAFVSHSFDDLPTALADVQLAFAGQSVGSGAIQVYLGSQWVGSATWSSGAGCLNRSANLTIPAATFNSRVNGGAADFSFQVTTSGCLGAGAMIATLQYDARADDCNQNGLPDACDLIPPISSTPPGNCTQAEAIFPGYTYRHQSTIDGTYIGSPPPALCPTQSTWHHKNVYYRYTPAEDGMLTVRVASERSLHPILYLHAGCPISEANIINCKSYYSSGSSTLNLGASVVAGQTYYIRVASDVLSPPDALFSILLTGPHSLLPVPPADPLNDCNLNTIPDVCDIVDGTSADCNTDGIPDECEPDCNQNGVPDICDLWSGASFDCNYNNIPDECDLQAGTSVDCNANAVPDSCDVASASSLDCNSNRVPDECEPDDPQLVDCDGDSVSDACQLSACRFVPEPPDGNGVSMLLEPFTYEFTCGRLVNGPGADFNIYAGSTGPLSVTHGFSDLVVRVSDDNQTWYEVQSTAQSLVRIPGDQLASSANARSYSLPDVLSTARYIQLTVSLVGALRRDAVGAIHALVPEDCNGNDIPDSCDISGGTSLDLDTDGYPDECSRDCDADGLPDAFEINQALQPDCDANGAPDGCEIADGSAHDCNANGVPDACDIAAGGSSDCDGNQIPDDCQADCDGNGTADACEGGGASLTADAGPDQAVCLGFAATIGGTPAALNGTPPYTYEWQVNGQPRGPSTIDQEQTAGTLKLGRNPVWQTFTAGASGELRAVEIKTPQLSLDGTLHIRAGDGGEILSSQSVVLMDNAEWLHFDLLCPVPVTAGEMYTIELVNAATVSVSFSADDPYPGGRLNGEDDWDMGFRTFIGAAMGVCQSAEGTSVTPSQATTRYTLIVTDANGCSATDDVLVSLKPDQQCPRPASIALGTLPPYSIGQVVPVIVTLTAPAIPGGMDFIVSGGSFEGLSIHIPEGQTTAEQEVVMQSLGLSLVATAEGGFGGPVSSVPYDVLPLVERVEILETPPFHAGDEITVDIVLREPAVNSTATVRLSGESILDQVVSISRNTDRRQVRVQVLRAGTGLTIAAVGELQCVGTAVSPIFEALHAGELYVDGVNGLDTNSGTSPVEAVKTINQAIALAADGYLIRVAAGTYPETLILDKILSFQGAGADQVVVDAQQHGRVITLNTIRLQMSDMTLANGMLPELVGNDGGGLASIGPASVELSRCTILDNIAGARGGGIYMGQFGELLLTDSTVSGNTAAYSGGGIVSYSRLLMTNSTISGNRVTREFAPAGGVFLLLGGGTARSCTITGNRATGSAGGAFVTPDFVLSHCIVAGNEALIEPDLAIHQSGATPAPGAGYNIIGRLEYTVYGNETDLIGVDPGLGPLAMNGGSVPSHALLPGSPAIDAGDPAGCLDALGGSLIVDQRGLPRPVDGDHDGTARCDIGSVERAHTSPADFDGDLDVDPDDFAILHACATGAGVATDGSLACAAPDLDGDGDVDMNDFGLFQRCYADQVGSANADCGL